jgi:tRNA 5-methylaminomethyl-2-thiouridine biosynthesis bifunctional protein
LQLAQDKNEQQLQSQIADWLELHQATDLARAVNASEASELAGQPLSCSGLFFPGAGWLEPKAVCSTLLQHRNIGLHCDTPINTLTLEENTWQLQSADSVFHADAVILCAANQIRDFAQTNALPLRPIRGQISSAPATELSQKLARVLCGEGYIAPAFQGAHSFGATFKLKDRQTDLREQEHRENLATLSGLLPDIAQQFAAKPLQGRAALRATTPDYLPLAGPVPKWDSLKETYARLGKDRKLLIPQTAQYWPGLFALGGLGSRGFTYAPLAAEVIAAWLCDEVMPVTDDLAKALHPARFAIRALIKNR